MGKMDFDDFTCEQLTLEHVELVGRGKLAILWNKFEFRRRLSPAERWEFERAKQRGYLIFQEHHRDRLKDLWFRWCELLGHPYVTVDRYDRYSEVTLDLIRQDWRLDDSALSFIWDLFRELHRERVLRCGTLGAYGDDRVYFRAVRDAWATGLAEVLLEMALKGKATNETREAVS